MTQSQIILLLSGLFSFGVGFSLVWQILSRRRPLPINIYSLKCLILLICFIVACKPSGSNISGDDPEPIPSNLTPRQVLKLHLDELYKRADFKRAYDYLDSRDQGVKSRALYVKELKSSSIGQQLRKKVSYKILDLQKSSNQMRAKIELTHPDIEKMVNDLLNSKVKGSEELKNELDKQLQTPVPIIKKEQKINLVQDNGQWRVFYDWSRQAKQKELRVQPLVIGDKAIILEHETEGKVELSITNVRFEVNKDLSKRFCIVEVQLTSQLTNKKFEQLAWMITIAPVIKDNKERIYSADFDLIPVLDETPYKNPFLKNSEPLLPGQSSMGELLFIVDKDAQGLRLEFDANWSSKDGKKLVFDLNKKREP